LINKNKKIWTLAIVILLLVHISLAEQLYSVSLVSTDQGLAYSSTEISEGEIPPTLDQGSITIEVIDFSGKLLYENKISPPLFQPFQLFIPYYKNGKEIKIITESESPLSIGVSHFADTCDNGVCEEHENFNSCKEDCSSGMDDSYCDKQLDSICDPDCTVEEDVDCKIKEEKEIEAKEEEENKEILSEEPKETEKETIGETKTKEKEESFPWWIILLILASIFIAIIIFLIYKDRKKHEKERLKQTGEYIQKYLNQGYSYQQIKTELIKYGYGNSEIKKAYEMIK
jgi:hypothetical protein